MTLENLICVLFETFDDHEKTRDKLILFLGGYPWKLNPFV